MPFHKALTGGQQEAFVRDSRPSVEGERGLLQEKPPTFRLQELIQADECFLGEDHICQLTKFQILKIQEFWEGWTELQYANNALRALPKGLQFFHVVSPSESPKVMGLAGIHNPEALCHFNGMTFCPCCGKEGQNEGTIVNHLWMTNYKLGLVCGTCFHCPSMTSKAILCHGQKSCHHPHGEDRGFKTHICLPNHICLSPLA